MKQFNLKEYLKNPSWKVVTRDGSSVRIICTDMKSYNEKIVGLIMSDTGIESIFTWTQQGKQYINIGDAPNDLFFAPETHEGWINVYRNNDGHTYAGAVYDSKEDAEKRKTIDENYVTTIKIEWEE